MSYINFAFTRTHVGGAPADFTTSSGFELGIGRDSRTEYLTKTVADRGPMPPRKSDIAVTPAIASALEGLKGAIAGAGGVRDIGIQQGDGSHPDLVTWVTGLDGASEQGLTGSLPASTQALLDASLAVEALVNSSTNVTPLPDPH